MRGWVPAASQIVVFPLVALSLILAGMRVADLMTLRGDITEFQRAVGASVQAERAIRGLAALEEKALIALSGDRAAAESRDRNVARIARDLRALRAAHPRARSIGAVAGVAGVAEREITRTLEAASQLAARGEFDAAQRLVEDDLASLIRYRLIAPLEQFTRARGDGLGGLSTQLREAGRHWLVSSAQVDALLHTTLWVHASESAARDVERDLLRLATGDTGAHGSEPFGDDLSRTLSEISDASLPQDPELSSVLTAVYAEVRERALRARADGGKAAVREIAAATALVEDALLPNLVEFGNRGIRSIERETDEIRATALALLVGAIGAALLAMGAGLFAPTFVRHTLRIRLRQLHLAVQALRAGRFNLETLGVDLSRDDEIGRIFRSLQNLANERSESRREVSHLSNTAGITCPSDRHLFEEQLNDTLLSSISRGGSVAVMSLQFDPRQLGPPHDAARRRVRDSGEEMQRQIAERIARGIEFANVVGHGPDSTAEILLSRLSSSEFSLVLSRINDGEGAGRVAHWLLPELECPFELNGEPVLADPSIGIALYPLDGDTASVLLANASSAARRARERDISRYEFCSEAINAASLRRYQIGTRLHSAIDRDELSLHFQPIRNARTGKVSASEVLLRWTDRSLGPVAPSEFIPIAEEAGLVERIGQWVLRGACEQGRAWREEGYLPLRLCVNVSPQQLHDDFADAVATALDETGTSPEDLELEIGEAGLVADGEAGALAVLNDLDAMGIGLVIDDFGTGGASLAYLGKFPIHRVKIDRRFTASVAEGRENATLADAIFAMTKSLGLRTVAGGIETIEQADFFRARGCDELQGFLFGPGVDAQGFERFLERDKDE